MGDSFVGEFEQMVLLAILQQGERAYAVETRRELEDRAGRSVSRGALYRTLDRLRSKGLLDWSLDDGGRIPDRGGHPSRRLRVTEAGVAALGHSRRALLNLWDGLETRLDRS